MNRRALNRDRQQLRLRDLAARRRQLKRADRQKFRRSVRNYLSA